MLTQAPAGGNKKVIIPPESGFSSLNLGFLKKYLKASSEPQTSFVKYIFLNGRMDNLAEQ